MDETNLPLHPGPTSGVVAKCNDNKRISKWLLCSKVPKKSQRGSLCLCAFIADNRDIQELLPQLLLIPKKLCTKLEFTQIDNNLPPNLFALHADSCWMQSDIMGWIVNVLRRVLAPKIGNKPIILSLDCAPIHLHWEPLLAMKRNGIVPLLISR